MLLCFGGSGVGERGEWRGGEGETVRGKWRGRRRKGKRERECGVEFGNGHGN